MKAQPLKYKAHDISEISENEEIKDSELYIDKDIKSAVDWLAYKIRLLELGKNGLKHKTEIIELIDEAFTDVMWVKK
jgi:hypothetical protein